MKVDVDVALGLVDPPPNFDSRVYESNNNESDNVERDFDLDLDESTRLQNQIKLETEGIYIIDSDVGDHYAGNVSLNMQNNENLHTEKDESVNVETENLCDKNEPSPKQIKREEDSNEMDDAFNESDCENESTNVERDFDLDFDESIPLQNQKKLETEGIYIIDSDVGDHHAGNVSLNMQNNENLHTEKDESVNVETENLCDKNEHSPKQNKREDDSKEMDAFNSNETTTCEELEEKLSCSTAFDDLEKVYLLYCEYARFKGFSVRKGEQRYFGRGGNIRWKEFLCSCAGEPNYRSWKHRLGVYKKLVTRSDCKARLIVAREDLGSFAVVLFEKDHNHELVPCDQAYLLRSSRNLNYAKKSVSEALNSVGIDVTKAFKFLEKESGGPQNVGCTKKDAFDHITRHRLQTKVEDGDAKLLFEYLTNKSNADPFFFWKYQLDDDGRLLNIFFRDGRCGVDYDAFGDVMCVGTTYRTNKDNLICAPFVGMNHHASNVMFGMAIMSDETTVSFKWLFEKFLESMHGKQPKVIFTNQCRAMMNAIDVTFPNSKHRLCHWHISKHCASNFGKLNGDSDFKRLWYKCMNIVETEDDFNKTWQHMMEKVDSDNRSWYDGMFKLRERWASVFSRRLFTGGILATSMSELTNKVLKQVVHSTTLLSIFVREYEEILTKWRTNEHVEDTRGIWNPGQVVANSGLLVKAATVYTRTIYKRFEFDLANCITVIVDPRPVDLSNNSFQYTARSRDLLSVERKVVFNNVTHCATCDCRRWETEGMICEHILKVLVIENVDDIPDSMIFRRWTKRAKDLRILEQEIVGEESYMTFANEFMRHMYDMVSSAMQNVPLRKKLLQRMKEFYEEVAVMVSEMDCAGAVERKTPITVPVFRNPKKVAAKGFADVRNQKSSPSPFASKGRKRGPVSITAKKSQKRAKATSKSKATCTINFMSTREEEEEDNDVNLTL